MKKFMVFVLAMGLSTSAFAQENSENYENQDLNTAASRAGTIGYWIEIAGLVTAAPGALSLTGAGIATAVGKEAGAFIGGMVLVQAGIGLLAGGLQLWSTGATVEYIGDGKLRMFSKADLRDATVGYAKAAFEAPESTRETFSPVVLSLYANDESVMDVDQYADKARDSSEFLQAVDSFAQEYKASNDTNSIPSQLALNEFNDIISDMELELSDAEAEAHRELAFRMLALNEVLPEEFLAAL